ncbi:MAG: gas vesicle protein GvpG [Oscillatoriales cyanobacterium SM2_1_8]|nr:gas vesicle protein GvpG [Oscillatoriales cyanobacterium SM2_1_8]
MVWQLLTFPMEGLLWIAEQVESRATEELARQEDLTLRLRQLQLRLDLGELDEAEFERQESELLAAIAAQEEDEP